MYPRSVPIGVRFKPEREDGLLFAAGSAADKNFVALDLQAGLLVFSFDLGDGPVVVRSDEVLEMNVSTKRLLQVGSLINA